MPEVSRLSSDLSNLSSCREFVADPTDLAQENILMHSIRPLQTQVLSVSPDRQQEPGHSAKEAVSSSIEDIANSLGSALLASGR
eukprot:746515-Hanusia_phi.AAC.1